MKTKKAADFYEATDVYLDSNGLMSICKLCINDMYTRIFENEKDISRTVLKLCRILNVKYDEAAVDAAKAHINTFLEKDKGSPPVFGIYKNKLVSVQPISVQDRKEQGWAAAGELTFHEPRGVLSEDELENVESIQDVEYLKRFWGGGITSDEYEFLESELDRYKRTHKSDTATEESLLRQICFAELDARNARAEGKSPDSAITRLQNLMKTASVDPAKTAVAGAGKAFDTFSSFAKVIEENEPADYYQDKKLFKDFDNINWYFKKYVTRPLKNFILQSRDFNVEKEDEDDESEIVVEEDNNDSEFG